MLSRLALTAVLLASCCLTSFAQTMRPASLENVHRVVCLGDSITQFGDSPGGYVWLVRHYLAALYPDMQVINAGVSGNRAPDMIARFQKDVLDAKPDLLTISVGVNDVWHGFDGHPNGDGPGGTALADYRNMVESMVDQALAANSRVVILSATVIGEDLNNAMNRKAVDYNRALRDIANEHHLRYVDYQRAFRRLITDYRKDTGGRDDLLTVDGVHMNASGNKVMAHDLLTALGVTPEMQMQVRHAVEEQERQGS